MNLGDFLKITKLVNGRAKTELLLYPFDKKNISIKRIIIKSTVKYEKNTYDIILRERSRV